MFGESTCEGEVLDFTWVSLFKLTSIAIAMSSEGVRSVGGAQREYPVTAGNVAGYFVLEDLPYCTPAQLSEWNLDPTKQPKLFLETLSNAWTSASVLCMLPRTPAVCVVT